MAIPDHPFGIFNKIVAFFDPGVFGFVIKPHDSVGIREEKVVLDAREAGGPYDTRIIENVFANREDWRGPQPTDLLTFQGSASRSGGTLARFSDVNIFKHGIKYAEIPSGFGAVNTAFFADKGDDTRNLVVITSDRSSFDGAQGIGFAKWSVLTKPEGRDPNNTELFNQETNPTGWTVVEEALENPNGDTNGLRFLWMGIWRPNKAGTEASCLVPINTVGDILPHDNFSTSLLICNPQPEGFGCQRRGVPGDGGDQVGIGSYRFRLMRMDFGAGGSSVSLIDEGENTVKVTRTRGTVSFDCVPRVPFPPEAGSFTLVITDFKDGALVPVAVDYDFETDARVFAFITHDGRKDETQTGTVSTGSNANGTNIATDDRRLLLVMPDVTVPFSVQNLDVTETFSADPSFTTVGGTVNEMGGGARSFNPGFSSNNRALYIDLRFGILIIGQSSNPSASRSWSGSADFRLFGFLCFDQIQYAGGGQRALRDFSIQGYVKGTKVFEYLEQDPSSTDPTSSFVASFFSPTSGFGFNCCSTGFPGFGSTTETWSLEMFTRRLDDFTVGLAHEVPRFAGVDKFGNIVMSSDTYSDRNVNGSGNENPGGPKGLTFLSNADLIAVLNQVTYAAGPLIDDGDARINNLENL